MRKILLIVAGENFRDEEYFVPKEILEDEGFYVETASDAPDTAFGSEGGEARIDLTTEEIEVDNYEGIFFVGGGGALKHLDNETSYKIAQDALLANKFLGAICISPLILAKAGVLKGKKATVWTSSMDKSPAKTLEEHGASFVAKPVVEDGKIITANGPQAARDFGKAIVKALTQDME